MVPRGCLFYQLNAYDLDHIISYGETLEIDQVVYKRSITLLPPYIIAQSNTQEFHMFITKIHELVPRQGWTATSSPLPTIYIYDHYSTYFFIQGKHALQSMGKQDRDVYKAI